MKNKVGTKTSEIKAKPKGKYSLYLNEEIHKKTIHTAFIIMMKKTFAIFKFIPQKILMVFFIDLIS